MGRILFLFLATAVLSGTLASPAWADGPTPGQPATPAVDVPETTIRVTAGPDGVTIYIGLTYAYPGQAGEAPATATSAESSGWSCTANIINPLQETAGGWASSPALMGWYQDGLASYPDHAPWAVSCGDSYQAIVWLPLSAGAPLVVVGPAASVDPSVVAAELLDHLPVPSSEIGASPAIGLVAVPSWFWAEGYDGSPIWTSETLGNTTVDVEIVPESYRWNFGDGASIETGSLGQRYPQVSDIRHTYERSSLAEGGAYTVSLEITFSAHYRVNGGPWQDLGSMSRTLAAAYPVQQLQAVLTAR